MKEWVLAASSAQLFPDDVGTGTFHCLPPPPSVDGGELSGITELLGLDASSKTGVDPLLGQVLGDVTLVRAIAEGGMGRVYEGLQDKPRRPVAVKVMRPGFVSQEVCRRFDNEAEVLGRLRHPYIAQIYSAGICTIVGAQVPFFVMEYVADSMPLTAYAKQHSLSTRQRLELFRKVCEAVAHGHEKGVIHRDLQPSNILVEPGGLPKVIDFGIARCVDATPEQMTALTDIGKLIGTVQYMSPEQFSGDSTRIDQRSDVYALGVILYELLAGKPPYKISHKQIFEAAQVVRKHRPAPLSKFNRDIDPNVEKVANRCLQKRRDQRFADAAEVANALGPCVDGRPIPKVARTSWSQRLRNNGDAFVSLSGRLLTIECFRPSCSRKAWLPWVALLVCLTAIVLSFRQQQETLRQQAAILNETQIEQKRLRSLIERAILQAARRDPIDALAGVKDLPLKQIEELLDGLQQQYDQGKRSIRRLNESILKGGKNAVLESMVKELQLQLRPSPLVLSGLTTLSPDAATLLANYGGFLQLDGVKTLSDEAAEALATHSGGLSLRSLANVSLPACRLLERAVTTSYGSELLPQERRLSNSPVNAKVPVALGEGEPGVVTNSVGMNLIWTQDGLFSILVTATTVTNAQWERVMGHMEAYPKGRDSDPKVGLRLHEVNLFCSRLSDLPEEKAAGRSYRPLTAAEATGGPHPGSRVAVKQPFYSLNGIPAPM